MSYFLNSNGLGEIGEVVVNLVFLALGQLSTAKLSVAIVREDNPL
jgi:hypothetical protein